MQTMQTAIPFVNSAYTPAIVYLNDDRKANAYLAERRACLTALQAEFKAGTQAQTETETVFDLGYVTVTRTATGWLVGNLPAIGFVAVQAYILARFW